MPAPYNPNNLLYSDLTRDLLDAFSHLNRYFRSRQALSEREMARALAIEMENRGRFTQREFPVTHTYNGQPIGDGFIDLVIDEKVAVEVKKTKEIRGEHLDQLRLYLEHADLKVGVALSFGRPYANLDQKSELRRVFRRIEQGD